jgi:hypothetical protein
MIGGVTARTGANRGSSAERAAGSYRDLLCMGLFSIFWIAGGRATHFGRTKPNCSIKRLALMESWHRDASQAVYGWAAGRPIKKRPP